MWNCDNCNNKNGNNSKNCHGKNCNTKRPESLETEVIDVRDFCPKCQSHQDFRKVGRKKFKCNRCNRTFNMIGKPVPEIEKELVGNELVSVQS